MDSICEAVVEQIALEGLDGITIPTLWLRLNQAEVEFPLNLNDKIKQKILECVVSHHELKYYKLANARIIPQIFNRFPDRPQIGCHISLAPDEQGKLIDAYPISIINDEVNFIRGSCVEYETRTDVTVEVFENENISEDFVQEKYGLQNLVIVASQRLRSNVLMEGGRNLSSKVLFDLSPVQYCVLERLGRARCQGELQSLLDQSIFKDHKTYHIHYVMRTLSKLNMVTRKMFTYIVSDAQRLNTPQILLHHVRYASSKFNQYQSIQAISFGILQEADQMLGSELQDRLKLDDAEFKKLYRLLLKCKRDVKVVHPDKSNKADRGNLRKKTFIYINKKNEIENSDDDDNEPIVSVDKENQLVVEHPFVLQAYHYILEYSTVGVTHASLLNCFAGYGKLEARNMHRILVKMNLVKTVLEDRGRQRLQKFVPTQLVQNNELFQDFLDAKKKLKYLILTSCFENNNKAEPTEDVVCLAKEDEKTLEWNKDTDFAINHPNLDSILSDGDTMLSDVDVKDVSFLNNITQSSDMSFNEPNPPDTNKWDANLTAKNLSRRNMILTHVNAARVVEGTATFYNLIVAEEMQNSDAASSIDRKTVRRIIERMSKEGFLKLMKVELSVRDNEKVEKFWFVAAAQSTDKEIKDAINQTKFKIATDIENKAKKNDKKELTKEKQYEILLRDVPHGKKLLPPLGQLPKFLKLKELHRFLFFLTYWNEDDFEKSQTNFTELSEDEVAWRNHVPLLPNHPDPALKGKIALGDLISVIPLYMVCHIMRIDQMSEEFKELLEDDKKKYMLLSNVPEKLQAVLIYRRKHVFGITHALETMAFMGLISLGRGGLQNSCNQQCNRKRDLDSILVHKNLTLLDTRDSEKGYLEISKQCYEQQRYYIDSMLKLDVFWQDFEKLSLLTQLGARNLKNSVRRSCKDFDIALKNFLTEHAVRDPNLDIDTGHVPGDGLGACGFDSTLYCHVYKNWTNSHFTKSKRYTKRPHDLLECEDVDDFETRPKKSKKENNKKKKKQNNDIGEGNWDDFEYEMVTVNNVGRSESNKGGKGKKRKLDSSHAIQSPKKVTLKPEKSFTLSGNARIRLDDIDREAIKQRNGRVRAKFSSAEDCLLVLCHVASIMIKRYFHIKRQFPLQMIFSPRMVRDILMSQIPADSYDKTAASCSKRIRYLMGFSQTQMTRDMCVLDAECDSSLIHMMANVEYNEIDDLRSLYVALVKRLEIKYDKQPGLCSLELPNTVKDLHKIYRARLIKPIQKQNFTIPQRKTARCIQSTADIQKFMLENLVYCTLLAKKHAYPCTSKQLAGIFNPYQDTDLQTAFNELKLDSTVTSKPRMNKSKDNLIPNVLPSYRLNYKYDKLLSNVLPLEDSESLTNLIKMKNDFQCSINCNADEIITMCNVMLGQAGSIDLTVPQFLISLQSLRELRKVQEEHEDSDTDLNETQSIEDMQQKGVRRWLTMGQNKSSNLHIVNRIKALDDISLQPCEVKINISKHVPGNPDTILVRDLQASYYEELNVLLEYEKYTKEFPDNKDVFLKLVSLLEDAGSMGIAVSNFSSIVTESIANISEKLLDNIVADLLDRKLVYKLGIEEWVYVCHKHAKLWFVNGYKYHNKAGTEENKITSCEVTNGVDVDAVDPNNYTAVKYNCQIWHKIDGTINPEMVKCIATSLYGYTFQNPGVKFKELADYYTSVIHTTSLETILDAMCRVGCLKKIVLQPKPRKHLFGRSLKPKASSTCYVPVKCSELIYSELITKLEELKTTGTIDVKTEHTC